MSEKRKRDDDGDAVKSKKAKHGFRVGPANLPDGAYKRHNDKVKQRLIDNAQLKKKYAKVKQRFEAEQRPQSTTAAPGEASQDNETQAKSTEPHPDRLNMMNGPEIMEEKTTPSGHNRPRQRRPRPNAYTRETQEAEHKRAEAEARRKAREEAEQQRQERIAERERFRKAMAKARTPDGQRKLGRESNALLAKLQKEGSAQETVTVVILQPQQKCRPTSAPSAPAVATLESSNDFTLDERPARDASSPQTLPQAMESSGHNAQVDMAIHMPNNAFDPFARDLNGFNDNLDTTALGAIDDVDTAAYMALPAQDTFHEHPQSSNQHDELANNALQQAPNPANLTQTPMIKDETVDFANYNADNEPVSAVSEMSLNLEEMKGYAQLVFPDGEYLVTSTEIMLGRDERAQHILKEQEKRQRRLFKEQSIQQARQRAAEIDAQAALESYKLEDTGSAEARRGSSASSLLEGRPAPGLPSTFSETGGIVNYEGVDDPRRRRNKRRHMLLSRSSSTTNSVAPASLHVYGAAAAPWGHNEDEKCIFLPIHPFQIEDIRKISKEHLRIFYDSVEKHWKMEIKGNGAFVLNELYRETITDAETATEETAPRHFKRGDTVILTHNTEVLVTSLTFLFKLPQRRGLSTFDSDDNADDLTTSPTQQRAVVAEDDSELSDIEEDVMQDIDTLKRPKIMLKASKPRPAEAESPEPPRPTGGKGKKKPSDTVSTPVQDAMPVEQSITPALPPVFDANSTLQHVPVNELPEKRKGPGRPPKNGLVSKRDEGIIRRKMKEYEKRGERPPPYKDILAIVRAENRAKELAARAVARGEPMPSIPVEMMHAPPTTEMNNIEPSLLANNTVIQTTEIADLARLGSQEPDIKPEMMLTAQSQQQQRTYKSPSPMKPKEEYSEEQLKRPTQTYYYILDEILTEGPEDAMELQQIYDKICKKYPFYKYVVESTGWQSSVRHNLKQNERFKPVSKQGKGWLWAIDAAVPLDKEKKKKPTPPPMPRPPMQYQQAGGVQYGTSHGYQGQYGTQYVNGQPQYPPANGQSATAYSTNYAATSYGQPTAQGQQAQPTTTGGIQAAAPQQSSQPAVPRTLSHPPSRPTSRTPQPTTAATAPIPPAFAQLVEEIMKFRIEYLSPFEKDAAEFARHERIFKRCVEWISQLHMRQSPRVEFENDEESRVFQILEKMRHKFEQGGAEPKSAQHAQPGQAPQQVQSGQAMQSQPGQAPQQLQSGQTSQSQPGHAPPQPQSTQIPQQNQQYEAPQQPQQAGVESAQRLQSTAQDGSQMASTQLDQVPAGAVAASTTGLQHAGLPAASAATIHPAQEGPSTLPAVTLPQSQGTQPAVSVHAMPVPATTAASTPAQAQSATISTPQPPLVASSRSVASPLTAAAPEITSTTVANQPIASAAAPLNDTKQNQQVAGVKRPADIEASEHEEKRQKTKVEQ